jgi:hypothetical protein
MPLNEVSRLAIAYWLLTPSGDPCLAQPTVNGMNGLVARGDPVQSSVVNATMLIAIVALVDDLTAWKTA